MFISDINTLLTDYISAMESVKLRLGLQTVMLISARGNTYLQASGLSKALLEADPQRCAIVVGRAVNLIYALTALVEPFMPSTADAILQQLNAPPRVVPDALGLDILPGHVLGKPEHLFKKIDESKAEEYRAKFAGLDGVKSDTSLPVESIPKAVLTSTISKRKQAAANKKTVADKTSGDPKSPAALVLEEEIVQQGGVVRELKSVLPRTAALESEIADAVDKLKKLKVELAAL